MMTIEMPEILNIVQGETLGQKMEKITACMNTVAFMNKKLKDDLSHSRVEVDGPEYERLRGIIDEQYARWEDCFIAILQTGIGDWIRDTEMWTKFQKSGVDAHEEMVNLIKEVHIRRDLGVDEQ